MIALISKPIKGKLRKRRERERAIYITMYSAHIIIWDNFALSGEDLLSPILAAMSTYSDLVEPQSRCAKHLELLGNLTN